MTLEALVQEIRSLPVEQRKQLVLAIFDSLTEEPSAPMYSILEFHGVASHLRDMDAHDDVNELRSAWGERP